MVKKARGHQKRFMETTAFLKQIIQTNFRGGLKQNTTKKQLYL